MPVQYLCDAGLASGLSTLAETAVVVRCPYAPAAPKLNNQRRTCTRPCWLQCSVGVCRHGSCAPYHVANMSLSWQCLLGEIACLTSPAVFLAGCC